MALRGDQGCTDMEIPWANVITAVVLDEGWFCDFFTDFKCTGASHLIQESTPNLGPVWNDKFVSYNCGKLAGGKKPTTGLTVS
jgi:hypothetical protein